MGIALLFAGLGLFCVLLWNFAVYALPAFIGCTAGFWALNHGAGLGCVIVGLAASVGTFLAGRFALMRANSLVRWIVITLFAVPAGYAGYSTVLALTATAVPAWLWQHVLALVAAGMVAATTIARLQSPIRED